MKDIVKIFNVSRKTVWKWVKRAKHPGRESFENLPKNPHRIKRKVDVYIENAVILPRFFFNWGTHRIKLFLEKPPPYIRFLLENVLDIEWKDITLSRQTINEVLKKYGRNGSPYRKNRRDWKFFRAGSPNELWQMDIKGPFRIENQICYALIIIDDHSRYIINCSLHRSIKTEDVTCVLSECIKRYGKPSKILVDNDSRFKVKFKRWCKQHDIEVIYTPLSYPQAKGKVERCIRTFVEEFLRLQKVFDALVDILEDFVFWFNNRRCHLGIYGYPADVYLRRRNVTDVT